MEGTRLVLVRHGESANQAGATMGCHRHCGGLSDLGREQAARLRDRLVASGELAGASALYASVLPRAVETATIIAPGVGDGHLDVGQECDLCELHLGEGDGLTVEEFERRWPAPAEWTVDHRVSSGGETFREMGERVARGLDAIAERHPGETVVVATHGGVVAQSLWRWLGLDPDAAGRAWFSAVNTSLTEWRFAPSPWAKASLPIELVRLNDHAHLA